MYILGINAYHADSSAAIFKDGKLIAATEEERFRRVKHWAGFPSMAIDILFAGSRNYSCRKWIISPSVEILMPN